MQDLNAAVPRETAYQNGRHAAWSGAEAMTPPARLDRATAATSRVAQPAAPAVGPDRRRSALVLLVEEPDPAALVRQLRDAATAVYQARSPAEAVKIARSRPEVGILICDLHFGTTHGPQFYRSMREELGGRDFAVVFLASAASINDIIAAVRVEAVDVLRKPAQGSQLADAVARAQAKLKRRASERAILRQATELFEASRDIVERLSDSLQSEALGIAPGEATSGEFDHRVDVPLDGADVAMLAATARLRRRVSQMVKSQTAKRTLFGDTAAGPSWNMLLDLYEKSLDDRPVSVTSVCVASGVPATTALRRLEDLLASGLVRRTRDEQDGRRSTVELTDAAKERLRTFFELIE